MMKWNRGWARTTDRVLFLTGTPMENRVEEFRVLVSHLQPGLVPRISTVDGMIGAGHFRAAVAPVYLRRNQDDVLQELPARVDTQEWVKLAGRDRLRPRHRGDRPADWQHPADQPAGHGRRLRVPPRSRGPGEPDPGRGSGPEHPGRLLAEDTVDQRMLDILATKADLFDEYVRRSELERKRLRMEAGRAPA